MVYICSEIFFGRVPEGVPYALITSCSHDIDFLKSSKSDPAIGLIFDSYRGGDSV
jgi:hypothetical protein